MSHVNDATDPRSLLRKVASCVWSQYFPEDHSIGIARPGDLRDAQYYTLVSESDGRWQAALAFRDCFRDENQWAPLLQLTDLAEPDITAVWLSYHDLVRTAGGFTDFENVFRENIDDVLCCLGLALCMVRHELRQEMEDPMGLMRPQEIPLDRTKLSPRLYGVTPVLPIGALKADVVGQFVSVVGTVVRVSAIKLLVRRCEFVCTKCNEATSRAFPDGKFNPPTSCENSPCRSRTLLPNRSTVETVDYQMIKCAAFYLS